MTRTEARGTTAGGAGRRRNRRGEGFRLRDDIIAAATAVLEDAGAEDAVTMRAIARRIGVAAPSVARHFPDRTAIIDAVVAEQLAVFHEQLLAAADAADEPVERLFALCHAYTGYARAHPARYRILVGRRFVEDWDTEDQVMEQTAPLMAAAIALVTDTIQACIDTGASDSTDAHLDTTILWFALHGLITIPQAITSLPWPDFDDLLATCITKTVGLHTTPTPAPWGSEPTAKPTARD